LSSAAAEPDPFAFEQWFVVVEMTTPPYLPLLGPVDK